MVIYQGDCVRLKTELFTGRKVLYKLDFRLAFGVDSRLRQEGHMVNFFVLVAITNFSLGIAFTPYK